MTAPGSSSSCSCSSSLWDSLPQELKDNVFAFCDPLTLYINGLLPLSDTHKDRNRTFEMSWKADLTLLPTFGFPTLFNGLCKVTSRNLYERLCILRPDLDHRVPGIAKDMIDIFVINDPSYGKINFAVPINSENAAPGTARPIKLQDDDDNIRSRRSARTLSPGEIRNGFVHYLINIPLRMCWMDLIEGYLRQNPKDMAIYAIVYLVELELVDVTELSTAGGNFAPFSEMAIHSNMEMVRLMTEIIRYYRGEYLEYIMDEIMSMGELYLFHSGCTTNMDIWEWHWDLCVSFGERSWLVPIPTDQQSAERIINKLSKNDDIHSETLSALANRDRKDLFQQLWNHQISTGRSKGRILGPS
ncbi:hypothetical protein HDU76_002171, partial [Blyttiomyces sp. JEL0837]